MSVLNWSRPALRIKSSWERGRGHRLGSFKFEKRIAKPIPHRRRSIGEVLPLDVVMQHLLARTRTREG